MSKRHMGEANRMIYEEGLSKAEYINQFGKFSFLTISESLWFLGPIALCAAALLIYVFIIWYRDWFGKNTFIYRLLMLPTSRMNVYLAKASAIFLMVLGLIAFQLILFPIDNLIFKGIIPSEFRYATDVRSLLTINPYFQLIIPTSFEQFLMSYGLGLLAVFVVFTAILFERSFRIKGIVLGVLFCIAAMVIFLSPALILGLLHIDNYLYPVEFFMLELFMYLLMMGATLWVSHYLITKKVTV
ncbi:hypothetical protein ACE38V_02380 [Cytobacillus sp. Hz8]|uniref:hypothetical protein n=1 Tax=Cytobacillus sp. Hz8 TaxID=3347168 RepID=UPI0035E09B0D